MTTKLVGLTLLCLIMSGTAMAQQDELTSLMSKDLPESPGKEMLMITVEHLGYRVGHEEIMWAKLEAMVEAARIASKQPWVSRKE
jgi:hypothetical protein